MLEAIIVDVEDVALMYEDGLDKYLRYTKATEMFDSDYSVKEIAKSIDTNDSTIYFWLIGKKTSYGYKKVVPKPVKVINRLGDLLPLSCDNPKFRLVNLIAGWAFWSGEVTTDKDRVVFSESREKLGALARIFDGLGYGYKVPKRGRSVLASDFALAKLLYLMGLPAEGLKSFSKVTIPDYILSLLEFKEDEDNITVIKDFLSTFLYLRTYSLRPNFMEAYGITKHNPVLLEKETNELCELMRCAGLESSIIKPTYLCQLIPRFRIRKDAIIDFIKGSSLGGYVKNLEEELE